MEIKARICFQITYKTAMRSTYLNKRDVIIEVPVDVTEVKADEFPVIYYISDKDEHINIENGTNEYVPYELEIRKWNGRLYRPVRLNEIFYGKSGLATTSELSGMIGEKCPNRTLPFRHKKWHIILRDNRNEKIDRLKAEASQYVIFGGNVWKQCGEPFYCIIPSEKSYFGKTILKVEYGKTADVAPELCFHRSKRESAIKKAKAIAKEKHTIRCIPDIGKDVNIIEADKKSEPS